jgi:hypothetical protein
MHDTDDATDRSLTEISEHQLKHCQQMTELTTAVNNSIDGIQGIAQALSVLLTILSRKGLVSQADIMAEIKTAEADVQIEDDKENWN